MFGVMEFMTFARREVTSALIHSGPCAQSVIEASVAWKRIATGLEESGAGTAAAASSGVSAALVPVPQVTANRTGRSCWPPTRSGNKELPGKPMRWDTKIAPWRECRAAHPRMRSIQTIDSEL